MKRALLVVGVVLLLVVLTAAGLIAPAFMGNKPLATATLGPSTTQLADGFVSAFLLDGGEGELALVDCGNDATGATVLRALAERHHAPGDVKAIFLTHGHADHTAGCHLFPSAQVYAFEGDVKLAAGEARSKGMLPSHMNPPPEKHTKVTQVLTDGQTVPVGHLSVKAYALPGHTAGSAAYLADGVLYLGDSASAREDGHRIKGPFWMFSDDTEQATRELTKLHARLKAEGATVRALAFGHSGALEGPESLDALLTPGR